MDQSSYRQIIVSTILLLTICCCFLFAAAAPSTQPINGDKISEISETDSKQYLDKSDFIRIYPKYIQNSNETINGTNGTILTTTTTMNKQDEFKEFLRNKLLLKAVKKKNSASSITTSEVKLNKTGEYFVVNVWLKTNDDMKKLGRRMIIINLNEYKSMLTTFSIESTFSIKLGSLMIVALLDQVEKEYFVH